MFLSCNNFFCLAFFPNGVCIRDPCMMIFNLQNFFLFSFYCSVFPDLKLPHFFIFYISCQRFRLIKTVDSRTQIRKMYFSIFICNIRCVLFTGIFLFCIGFFVYFRYFFPQFKFHTRKCFLCFPI